MSVSEIAILKTRVDGIEKNLEEFNKDFKEEIKELKRDIKHSEEIYHENLLSLRENLAVLTTIAKGHEAQINELKQSNKPDDEDKKWYRQMLTENHKWLWYVLILVIGTLCGANWDAITSFLHK
jgi:hypothetical protein